MKKYRDKIFGITAIISSAIFLDGNNIIFNLWVRDILLILTSAYWIYYSISSLSKINKDDSLSKRIGAKLLYYSLIITGVTLIVSIVKQNFIL
ncbi:MAG: hypothetical protein GX666_06320 [Tissierellia bacterium]|nr:hypothetical protein [Tissierellia bacterium]